MPHSLDASDFKNRPSTFPSRWLKCSAAALTCISPKLQRPWQGQSWLLWYKSVSHTHTHWMLGWGGDVHVLECGTQRNDCIQMNVRQRNEPDLISYSLKDLLLLIWNQQHRIWGELYGSNLKRKIITHVSGEITCDGPFSANLFFLFQTSFRLILLFPNLEPYILFDMSSEIKVNVFQ